MLETTSRLLDLWRARCNGRDIPDRANLHAEDFAPWMGRLVICDVERDPRRFRLRLIGTAVRELDGRDYTGWYLDEALEEPLRRHVLEQWALCADRRRPVLINSASSPHPAKQIEMEKLMVPFSTGADAVGQILTYFHIRRANNRSATRWPTLQEMEVPGFSSVRAIE
ncbi:PAS domain-containing protein [Inquilinus sp. CAU 1745]|uniref:PAS domain-containing protein n=1 Tax=Inquilinus sp. CAU 1745 TaxID=3140369 RepID=UPI00325B66B5